MCEKEPTTEHHHRDGGVGVQEPIARVASHEVELEPDLAIERADLGRALAFRVDRDAREEARKVLNAGPLDEGSQEGVPVGSLPRSAAASRKLRSTYLRST
jgi:hypothetical protein